MTQTKVRRVACPRCGKAAEYSEANPARPFCSPTCRLIDLGAWASGDYRIAGTEDNQESPQGDSQCTAPN